MELVITNYNKLREGAEAMEYKAEDLRAAWFKSSQSQEEIAAKIEVSQPAVSMALAGKRGNSRKGQQTLKKIAQVLKIKGVEKMGKTYNGWANWETWNFMLHEGDNIQYSVQVGMSFAEVKDLVYTHISFLAENEETENLSDIAREFAIAGFDNVDIREIAEAVYDNLKEDYELI